MDKKGISSIVAVVTLLSVTVLAALAFQNWYISNNSSLFTDIDSQESSSNIDVEINEIIGDTLYLDAGNNLNIKAIEVGGVDCNINDSYQGVVGINIGECLSEVSSSRAEVKILSDNSVKSKTLIVPNIRSEELDNFIFQINVSYPGYSGINNFTLFLDEQGSHNFNVDWGDGTSDIITSWNQSEITHEYSTGGVYNVTLDGVVDGFSFTDNELLFVLMSEPEVDFDGFDSKLIDVLQWGDVFLSRNGFQFLAANNLKSFSAIDSPTFENMTGMFAFTQNFNGDISNWDTSSVTDYVALFSGSINFSGNASDWKMNFLTLNPTLLFSVSENFNGDISNWDFENSLYLSGLFGNSINFSSDISNWDTSNIINMDLTFYNVTNFNSDISNWNTSNTISMQQLFYDANDFNQDISNWNINNVTTMNFMFYQATSFNQNLSNWNLSNVQDCFEFDIGTISWQENFKPNISSCSGEFGGGMG